MFSRFVQFGRHNSVLQATCILMMLGGQPWDRSATCSAQPVGNLMTAATCSAQPVDNLMTVLLTCSAQPVDNLMTMLLPAQHNQLTIAWQCWYLLTTTSGQSHDSTVPAQHNHAVD